MTWLLDGNVLVALAIDSHVFHERVSQWFDALNEPFATCAITEGTLLRLHMKMAANSSPIVALAMLEAIHAMRDHEFWNEGFSYREVPLDHITGPAQVTDAWLVELARQRRANLATLDTSLAHFYSDVGFLIPE